MKTLATWIPFRRLLKLASFLVVIALLLVPSNATAQILYQIDDSDRIAIPTSLLGVSVYASTQGGIWRLVDGDTYQMNSGPNENVRGLPAGVSLVSIASSTASTMYAYGSDSLLYQVDDSDRIATPTSLLGISVYAATQGGIWRLVDGDTYQMNSGPNENVRGLPDGLFLSSIASSTSSTMYAYAVPEPSTIMLLFGAGVLIFVRRLFC